MISAFHRSQKILPPEFVEFSVGGSAVPSGNAALSAPSTLTPAAGDPSTIGDSWVQRQLVHYEDQYTTMEPLPVTITSFNVASKKPPTDLAAAIPLKTPDGTQVDIVVVGLQELDMSAGALLKEETDAQIPWVNALRDAVDADIDQPPTVGGDVQRAFRQIGCRQLVGLFLIVFVRKTVLYKVKRVSISTVSTGALGTLGNKGGVGLRLEINLSSFVFLNCHLAAGQAHYEKRNVDTETILSSMNLELETGGAFSDPTDVGSFSRQQTSSVLTPLSHDVVVFFGDLNYRCETSYETAVDLCAQKRYAELFMRDQLAKEMKKGDESVYHGFTDLNPSHFCPTYRFDVGTSTYDTSEKRRIPAYTDRIMYWTRNKRHADGMRVLKHDCVPSIVSSDHKPVFAVMNLPVKTVVESEREKTLAMLKERLTTQGLDRVMTAKATISCAQLDFGTLCYRETAKRTITLTNSGQCVAEVSFLRRVSGDIAGGQWLSVSQPTVNIFPSESREVAVECIFDREALGWLADNPPFQNQASVQMSTFLVVSVRDGPTQFIECVVVVTPSVWGNTLENLARLQRFPCAEGYALGPADAPPETSRPQIPKELWFLVDALFNKGSSFPQLFLDRADAGEMAAVMTHIETQLSPIPPEIASPQAIANCLLVFLNDLQSPVVPYALFSVALQAGKSGGKAPVTVVSQFPAVHYNAFIYIMAFLRHLLLPQHAKHNELDAETLAAVFGRVLVRRQPGTPTKDPAADRNAAASFVSSFLMENPASMA